MAVTTHSFKYKPTTAPSGTEDRVLACSHTTDDCHCVINSSGQIGYYVSGVFTQIGTATVSLNEQYAFIIEHDDTGNGCIYLNGQKIGCATNFPTSAINQIGNFKTELKPETGRKPKVGLKPRSVSNIYTRPCCGIIDEYARFNRALSASEVVDLSQSGTLSKVYTLADYKIALMADDGIIATTEKPRYKENWRSIWDADQRTSALPTAIASITVNGSYKSLATAANDAGIWTPTTNGTPAYDYYQAVESWRQMYFVSSGGGTGFLLTANLAGDTDISEMSPTLEARQSTLMFAEDALRSAVMIKRQSTAELTAVVNANAYTDELEDALRSQTDHAIVFTTSASDPSTSWTAEEKLIHKGDYWRVDTSSAWKTWTGTTWGTVNDAQAQAAASAAASAAITAQTTADKKTTLWATLAVANSDGAVAGDMFMDSSLIYRCLTSAPDITVANSTRITSKNFGNLASAPTGAIANDRYYNTTTLTWYRYTGSAWTADGDALNTVTVTYTPKYLGRYLGTHPASYNNGDWWLVYDTDDSPIVRGFWYSNNGTPARVSLLSAEAQRKYKGVGLEDVLYASNNGYALLSGVYNPVAVYGVSVMEYLAVNQAFIRELVTQVLEFEESVSSIAGNTLVPRSGSTPGTQQIYMGKNPRYPDDATRAYEFALQEYLGMDGAMEVWTKHFWTRFLKSGNVSLSLTGSVLAQDGLFSKTGIIWSANENPFSTSSIQGCAVGLGLVVIVSASGVVKYSIDDGVSFITATHSLGAYAFNGVSFCGEKFFIYNQNGGVAYSTNGSTYTTITNPYGSGIFNSFMSVSYGNGVYLFGGFRKATSTTGTTLTGVSLSIGRIYSIAFANQSFIIGADDGVYKSVNGTTATMLNNPFGSGVSVTAVAYGNGICVIGSLYGEIAYSYNENDLVLSSGVYMASSIVNSLKWSNGRWIAVGNKNIITSIDAKSWEDYEIYEKLGLNAYYIECACTESGKWIAVGQQNGLPPYEGVYVVSDPLEAGGGVVGKVYDTARGELNKLWDGRYFPSYASVDEIAPKKYFRFPAGTTTGSVFNALEPYVQGIGNHTSCLGSYGTTTPPALLKRESVTNIQLYGTDPILLVNFTQGAIGTIPQLLTLEFIPVS